MQGLQLLVVIRTFSHFPRVLTTLIYTHLQPYRYLLNIPGFWRVIKLRYLQHIWTSQDDDFSYTILIQDF